MHHCDWDQKMLANILNVSEGSTDEQYCKHTCQQEGRVEDKIRTMCFSISHKAQRS